MTAYDKARAAAERVWPVDHVVEHGEDCRIVARYVLSLPPASDEAVERAARWLHVEGDCECPEPVYNHRDAARRLCAALAAAASPADRAATDAVPDLLPLLPYGVKMLREHLCLAQFAVNQTRNGHAGHSLQAVIDWCDLLRPTGPDCKHGDRHTPWCGCDDNPLAPVPPTADTALTAALDALPSQPDLDWDHVLYDDDDICQTCGKHLDDHEPADEPRQEGQ